MVQLVKNPSAIQENWVRSPGEGKDYSLQYSGLENTMDHIVHIWGCKESDTTEQLSLHFILNSGNTHIELNKQITSVYIKRDS